MLLNCGIGKDSWESLGLQRSNQSILGKSGNQSWIFTGRTDAEAKAPILWPPDVKSWLWCWERLKVGREGDDCQEPAWGTPPMAKVMRKEASAYAKSGSSLRKSPVPEHLPPKPESAHFTVLCSHLHLWLYGGLSPITSLQLQLIKIPGHDKSVSTYELLWRLSSLPVQVHPATCDCLQPPNRERHMML